MVTYCGMVIQQGQFLDASSTTAFIAPKPYRLAVSGDGNLEGTNDLTILGDALIEGGEISIYGDDPSVSDGRLFYFGDFEMTANSSHVGVDARTVEVTGGSTLNVGCAYGVFIHDGKLTVDSTSKLITDATVAPFVLIDTTNTKSQSEL